VEGKGVGVAVGTEVGTLVGVTDVEGVGVTDIEGVGVTDIEGIGVPDIEGVGVPSPVFWPTHTTSAGAISASPRISRRSKRRLASITRLPFQPGVPGICR
jgi:hypothetical protein